MSGKRTSSSLPWIFLWLSTSLWPVHLVSIRSSAMHKWSDYSFTLQSFSVKRSVLLNSEIIDRGESLIHHHESYQFFRFFHRPSIEEVDKVPERIKKKGNNKAPSSSCCCVLFVARLFWQLNLRRSDEKKVFILTHDAKVVDETLVAEEPLHFAWKKEWKMLLINICREIRWVKAI